MVRELVAAALALLLVSGCDAQPEAGAPPFNDTDVMFLQMGLTQIDEGDQVAALAEQRAADPRLRSLATELRAQWREESATMRGRLQDWKQPLEADPSAGAHAGHGDLHNLRPSDIGELSDTRGKAFDRTAVTLLLGHLGNCVETARMESAGGAHPDARALGANVASRRLSQIQSLLKLAAEP
ncbi:DUF305 domain-containing protein [Paractinoplanes hotanensis]|uniref:DUF305 domain-containing protein n=1 Tax=Paractinoplanes hotanensis TaxID=2906497 RepID=A0ABT0XX97_9ACTN|nr:DUF305 domain-containing protein [Actinoplanes hotanensis]MCM4077822.1 DUF305 domain-containing protein [Actinoplanes hotanensis]